MMIVAATPMMAQMRKFPAPALVYLIVSPPEANSNAPAGSAETRKSPI